MHVALYYPGRLPVEGYGGTQRVVVWLARGLAELGHRVTLLAFAGSRVPEARLVVVPPATGREPAAILPRAMPRDADLLHAHVPLPAGLPIPALWTLHGNRRPGAVLPASAVCVSADHARRHGAACWVHNGLDPAEYRLEQSKRDYDLFLGRLHAVKGYRWAIEGARRAGRRLVVAGGWRPSLRRDLQYVGSVTGARKGRLLAGARCLWMPAQWDEPFGLTLVEALVSGTPVLGTRRGALPEVVTPEVGALGDTLEELVALRGAVDRVDPHRCRDRALRGFTHRTMADGYVRMYRHFLETGTLPPGRPAAPDD